MRFVTTILALFLLTGTGIAQGKLNELNELNEPNRSEAETGGANEQESFDYYLYIGTYSGESKGIYLSHFNSETGYISVPELVAELNNASFQCITGDNSMLWSVCESWSGTGSVYSFNINLENGQLTPADSFSSLGHGPCYVDYNDLTGYVATANYNSGNVTLISTKNKNTKTPASYSHQHEGTGPVASRQGEPHAHCSKFGPLGKYLYSCDLGADKIYVYTIKDDKLEVYKEIKTRPGAGPRHLAFQPCETMMAVVCELNGTIETYLPDEDGCYSIFKNVVPTLPESFNGFNKCADIHYTHNGQYLYASNRGHNSIVVFSVDPELAELKRVGWQTSNIQTPRNFCIDPSGNFLLAANKDGNNIVVFKIDPSTGMLEDTGYNTSLSKPACLNLLKKD